METENAKRKLDKASIEFWISMIRGVLAILLGVLLIFDPEKTRGFLFNMMGMFWLANGFILLRHANPVFGGQEEKVLGRRTSLALWVVAIIAGLLVISRTIIREVLPEEVLIVILGAVILLTGILHLMGERRVGRYIKGKRTAAHKTLAVFEILLGGLLIYSPLDLRPIVYWTATAWALIGGGLIITDAIRVARKKRIE